MITRKISQRQLHKKKSVDKTTLIEMMARLGVSSVDEIEFLSPKRRADERYVTSESNLNKKIDPRIFRETQLKRMFRWLSNKPPIIKIFFNWLFVKKMKMKLDYFSQKEDAKPETIFKDKMSAEHQVEDKVINDFKIHNLGHATQLIQTEGMNILTDPVFGNLAAVIYPSMTKSFRKEIQLDDLPPIDVILVSHNHRDHVDEKSLRDILKKGYQPTLLVPMGDATYFKGLGFKIVQEMEWHEEITFLSPITNNKVTICNVPADHRSGRNGFDSHKSLVSGWVISPKNREEIVYFAGDTARLNRTRILSLALDIYSLYKHKKTNFNVLPHIINMSPGGPNYTRRDMQPTHQSALDSLTSAFRLAIELAEISKIDNQQASAEEWLKATATVFMHHNRFELGPDRFNENIFIYNRVCSYLGMNDNEFSKECLKQRGKNNTWSLFHYQKDFVTQGVVELRALAEQIWPGLSSEEKNQKLYSFIQSHTHFPLINEKIKTQQFFRFDNGVSSTIKPETTRGWKFKR
jgi:hypothetical protein